MGSEMCIRDRFTPVGREFTAGDTTIAMDIKSKATMLREIVIFLPISFNSSGVDSDAGHHVGVVISTVFSAQQ